MKNNHLFTVCMCTHVSCEHMSVCATTSSVSTAAPGLLTDLCHENKKKEGLLNKRKTSSFFLLGLCILKNSKWRDMAQMFARSHELSTHSEDFRKQLVGSA